MLNPTNTKIPRPTYLAALVALGVVACGGSNMEPKSSEPVVLEEAAVAAETVETEVEGAEDASERAPVAPSGTGTEVKDDVKPAPQAPEPRQP